MKNESKEIALEQLDKNLMQLPGNQVSSGKWIKTIRTTLGMSMQCLAKKLGVSQPSVASFESREQDGSITIKSLNRVAEELGCNVVYYLKPKTSLSAYRFMNAQEKAEENLINIKKTLIQELQMQNSHHDEKVFKETKRYLESWKSSVFW